MGTYWYWACRERGEYIDSGKIGDNQKEPINQAAVAAFYLLKSGRWTRAELYSDAADLPWEVVSGWCDVTDEARALIADFAFRYDCDKPEPGAYRAVRVASERAPERADELIDDPFPVDWDAVRATIAYGDSLDT